MSKLICYTGLGPNAKSNAKAILVKKLPDKQKTLTARIKAARTALKLAEKQLNDSLKECDCSYFKDEAGFPFTSRYCVVCGSHIYDL